MTDTKTLAGRPINGDINHYSQKGHVEQWPIEEFFRLLDDLFAFDEVDELRWEQYTPYFNDGDACTFDVGELRIKLTGDSPTAGDYEDGYRSAWDLTDFPDGYYDNHAHPASRYDFQARATVYSPLPEGILPVDYDDRVPVITGPNADAINEAFTALSKAMRHFEDDFHKHFGDPAQVTATRTGFDVEHYEHD